MGGGIFTMNLCRPFPVSLLLLALTLSTLALGAPEPDFVALPGVSTERSGYVAELLRKAREIKLAEDLHWLRLGHYKKRLMGGYESQVVGESFWVSASGKTDPAAELEATLQGFFSTEERAFPPLYPDAKNPEALEKQHVICHFPARLAFLAGKLAIDPTRLPSVKCTGFERFSKSLSAKSLSLVFSSYYLGNPSSTFGHSLLRFSRSEAGSESRDKLELLDHGINFAAEVTVDNALVYAIYGLAGGFRGTFSNIPYYYKVREYNDYETRDLWSYDLNLTQEEIDLLVAHLWEIGQSHFDYYYFTQNCSYQILTALEAAAPRFSITEKLPFYVIPVDTIKQAVATPGLVGRISYRPSIYSTFRERYGRLSGEEVNEFEKVALLRQTDRLSDSIPVESRTKILDAALDFIDYKNPKDLVKPDSESARWKQKLLVARAAIQFRSEVLKVTPRNRDQPHVGHGSARLGLGGGYERGPQGFADFKMRFALHDLGDPPAGYLENSQIEFGNVQGRYYVTARQLELEKLSVIRVTALNPVTSFNKDISWRIDLGGSRVRERNCERCFAGMFEIGVGYVVQPARWLTLFALGEGELAYSPGFFEGKWRLGAGPAAGWVAGGDVFKMVTRGQYRFLTFSPDTQVYDASVDFRLNTSQRVAFGLWGAVHSDRSGDAALTTYFYF